MTIIEALLDLDDWNIDSRTILDLIDHSGGFDKRVTEGLIDHMELNRMDH